MTKTKEAKPMKVKNKKDSLLHHVKKEWKLYSFMLIPILYYIIFKYIPVFGNLIAFRRYRGGPNIFGDYWVGFRYFEQFLTESFLEYSSSEYWIFAGAFPGNFDFCFIA